MTGRGGIADLELDRLVATEPAGHDPGDDIEPVAFVHVRGEVGPPEGDGVDDIEPLAQGQLGVAAVRGADTGHGEALDGDERIGVPGPGRVEPPELGQERVVDLGCWDDEVDPELGASIRRGREVVRDERQEALAEGSPSDPGPARSRPRRHARRAG